jgi:hypothetical protein
MIEHFDMQKIRRFVPKSNNLISLAKLLPRADTE